MAAAKLFSKIPYNFSDTADISVVTKWTFQFPFDQAVKVCQDYSSYIALTCGIPQDSIIWEKGGPGIAPSVVTYAATMNGVTEVVTEEVTETSETVLDDNTRQFRLEYQLRKFQPKIPVSYRCVWEMKSDISNPNITHLVYTRVLKQVYILGFIPMGQTLADVFKRNHFHQIDTFVEYYHETYPKRLPHDKNARIAIIGAGPSGLLSAYNLIRRGYKNITILEKENRYGGKTVTKKYQPPIAVPPLFHELGTCYLDSAYYQVFALFEQLEKEYRVPKSQFELIEVDSRSYTVQYNGSDKDLYQWCEYQSSQIPDANPFSVSLLNLLSLVWSQPAYAIELWGAVQEYNRLHAKYFHDYNFTMPLPISRKAEDALSQTFYEFLTDHSLGPLIPIVAYASTCQGYGTLTETPAFWGFTWITPDLLKVHVSSLLKDLRKGNLEGAVLPKKYMLKNGWHSVWDVIVQKVIGEDNIKLNVKISEIDRNIGKQNGKGEGDLDNSISITYAHKGFPATTARFDYLVVAAPIHLTEEAEIITDLTPLEKEVFHHDVVYSTFCTNLYECEKQPELNVHLKLYANALLGVDAGQGEVMAMRDSFIARYSNYDSILDQRRVDQMRPEKRQQMCYQYVRSNIPPERVRVREKFHEWLNSYIPGDSTELKREQWNYFYHYDYQGLTTRKPWQVLGLQGENKTIYAHASTYFESVLDLASYQSMLYDNLQGKDEIFSPGIPQSDAKPDNGLNGWSWAYFFLGCLLNFIWIPCQFIFHPLITLVIWPIVRWFSLWDFHTENVEHTSPFSLNMHKYVKMIQSVTPLWNPGVEDPVVTQLFETLNMEESFPFIKRPQTALQWSLSDYRIMVREWVNILETRFPLYNMPEFVRRGFRALLVYTPRFYNFLVSNTFAITFGAILGFNYYKEDEKGGGVYVPRCIFLKQAREDYTELQARRICTHVCKVFTEEMLSQRLGVEIVFEPDINEGSCMIRGRQSRNTCGCNNDLLEW